MAFLACAFFTIWAAKLVIIGRYGTDLPFWDQWAKEGELFYAPWFERHEFWRNIFVPHNEHRIAPTLALNLGLLEAGGNQWDARVQCVASAALHAFLALGLAAWAWRRLPRRWAVAAALLVVLIAAPPIAWENVLGGFQSQFYFLAGFSLLAIGGLLGFPAFSAPWIGGALAAGLACVSMGSGMLVAVPIAAIAVWRIRRKYQPSAVATLVVAILVGAIGGWFRSPAPWQSAFHAHSTFQYLTYAARCLAWPAYGVPWLAALFWAPWVILLGRVLRFNPVPVADPSRTASTNIGAAEFVLAGGAWVLVQVAAVTYSRAGASPLPAPRYGDICALGIVFNFCALALCGKSRVLVRIATGWLLLVAACVTFAARAAVLDPLPTKKSDAAAYEHAVQDFVLTDDYATFSHQPLLPFPSPEWLARIIRDPTLRRLLPPSVRAPITIPHLAGPSKPAPPLPHRAIRALHGTGEWRSSILSPDRGWWKFETAGDIGGRDASLELVAAAGGQVLARIAPTKPAGNSWRAAYVPAPHVPAVLVAHVTSRAAWLGWSEPIEMSTLGYRTWRLTQNAPWLLLAATAGLLAMTLLELRASHASGSSRAG